MRSLRSISATRDSSVRPNRRNSTAGSIASRYGRRGLAGGLVASEGDSMLSRQHRSGAAVAGVLLAVTPLAACGSDDSGGGGQAADETAGVSSTTEATTTTTSVPEVPSEDVAFTSADGVALVGRIYGEGATAIVASHESGASKGNFEASGPRLAAAGFTVLAYDNRGDGASDPGDPDQRIQDLIAAVDLVRTRGATKVFLLGASRGGTLSLTGATQTPVDGVITISAPPPEEGPASVAAVTVPSLYVNSENDGYADSTQAMYDAANEPRQLQMYPGGGHGVALFARHPDLIDLVVNFIREHRGA